MTNQLVEINNTTLEIKEFQGQRVVTFKDIDTVHARPNGTSRKAFNRNKKRLINGEDYFILKPNVHETDIRNITIPNRGITILTESGYLLLVKVFDDDLAWQVQRQLVSNYFQIKEIYNKDNVIENKFIELLTSMDNRLSKLEEQSNKKKLPEKKYSRWKTNTFKKLNTLLSYVNGNSDENLSLPNIMHLVIGETEDIYNIEVNEYVDLYRCEFCIDADSKVQVLDVINHYKDIRDMFTLTLNSIMEKLHIVDDTVGNRTKNIFDELASKIES